MICLTSFVLKPAYEIIALLIFLLIRNRKDPPVRALAWGMLAFFLGESACAINFLFYRLDNFAWEFWHCYGMMIAFGFMVYAVMDFTDRHVLHFTDRGTGCVFLRFCHACSKSSPSSCTIRRLVLFLIPAAGILCLLPISAPIKDLLCIGTVFYNDVLFAHPVLQQWFEIRIYPGVALLFYLVAWLTLLRGKEEWWDGCKLLLAAATGILGFSLMRLTLFWVFSDNILWANTWEEITEFLFVLGAGIFFYAPLTGARPALPPRRVVMPAEGDCA